MVRRVSEAGMSAWQAFLNAHVSIVSHIESELFRRKLVPFVWYDVLTALSEAPEQRMRMGELARRLMLTRSGATRLVDNLESAGLIARERCDRDRRGCDAVLTPKGVQALRRAWPVYADGINRVFLANLSANELETITVALRRVGDTAGRPAAEVRG